MMDELHVGILLLNASNLNYSISLTYWLFLSEIVFEIS